MQISLLNAGKRYNREWIFRHLDFNFLPGGAYAITGANGSGKSTLLQVIAGAILQSEGQVQYHNNASGLNRVDSFRFMAIAAPYLELVEEMTATEFLNFHSTFKELTTGAGDILQEVGLQAAAGKQIRYFSSGMKQRLKLAQAFFSKTPVLLLDEPTTNLDAEGTALYHSLVAAHSRNRLVIISSNDEKEYSFCQEIISISDYK